MTNQDSIEHNFTFDAANANQDVEGGEDATVTFTAPGGRHLRVLLQVPPGGDEGDRHGHLNTSTVFVL